MWKLISFVKRGRLRMRVMEALATPSTPTDLARKLNSHRSTVSQIISELKAKGLVKRLNPVSEKTVSIYQITPKGSGVMKKIGEM